jgi:hypothetical protein
VEGTGVRRYLQPLLYMGLAFGVHALLFLIPVRLGPGSAGETTRGVRVRAVKESPPPDAARARTEPRPATPVTTVPPVPSEGAASRTVVPPSPGGGSGTAGGGGGQVSGPAGEGGAPGDSAYGSYLARLRSEGVQGWARDSAGRAKQEWKGSGKAGTGWGAGGTGAGEGPGGKGTGKGGGGYLDPRVQMVVTSYPPTAIEKGYTQVPYPDLKVKQHQATAGWWNVYIQVVTDKDGRVVRRKVLRPETDGPLERMFVDQVQKEIDRWAFERAEAEILVDVRFHVE